MRMITYSIHELLVKTKQYLISETSLKYQSDVPCMKNCQIVTNSAKQFEIRIN